MKVPTYENALNHWKNAYLVWNPMKFAHYGKNFYIGLSYLELNTNFASVSGIAYAFYSDTDKEI